MTLSPDLAAPVLLVAMPQILDPLFHKSVVLLVHHDEQGSFGLVLNRRSDQRVATLLTELDIVWRGDVADRVHLGGPVQTELGTVLFAGYGSSATNGAAGDAAEASAGPLKGAIVITPEQTMTHHIDDLAKLAESPPQALRLFLGYAGWGAGQLIEEISRNDWLTAPIRQELLYADPEAAWHLALAAVGVDPDTLPAWSPALSEHDAN